MKNVKKAIVFVVSFAAAGAAFGEVALDRLWKDVNTNRDDVISVEEAKASEQIVKQWNVLDVNQDQMLTYKEFMLLDLTQK